MRIDAQEFRHACDTLVRFTQEHTGLTDKERELVVMVVKTLEYTLASSSSPATRGRHSRSRRITRHSLIG
jgi:hypothetical protein